MKHINKYYLPSEDVNEDVANITEIFFKNGDFINKDDIIFTFETTKATVDVTSEKEGFIYYFVEKNQEVKVGTLICQVSDQKQNIVICNENSTSENVASLTKKAIMLADKHNLDINELGLKGVVREKDILPFIGIEREIDKLERCKFLHKNNNFIKYLLESDDFKFLPSSEKIKIYRQNGCHIENNVIIGQGSVLIGNEIKIGSGVFIGQDTYIEAPEILIGKGTQFGSGCNIVGSKINIGDYNRIANKVIVDISGGRYPDSDLITGRGCLAATEVYINISREVCLGENVALSPKAMIFTHSYWQSVLDGYSSTFGSVKIESDSWIGAASQVMPNVHISNGSIVMSNSLVINNVGKFTLVGGVPASTIKENIKKNYSVNKIINKLTKLFDEMFSRLNSLNYEIEKKGANTAVIKRNAERKTIALFDPNYSTDSLIKEVDILIIYQRNKQNHIKCKTMLIIDEKKIEGPIGEAESYIIEFFRRKGINFYE